MNSHEYCHWIVINILPDESCCYPYLTGGKVTAKEGKAPCPVVDPGSGLGSLAPGCVLRSTACIASLCWWARLFLTVTHVAIVTIVVTPSVLSPSSHPPQINLDCKWELRSRVGECGKCSRFRSEELCLWPYLHRSLSCQWHCSHWTLVQQRVGWFAQGWRVGAWSLSLAVELLWWVLTCHFLQVGITVSIAIKCCKMSSLSVYWVGKKICLGFPISTYGKTQTTFLANPVSHRIDFGTLKGKIWTRV